MNTNLIKQGKRIIDERHLTFRDFWNELINRSKGRTPLFEKKIPKAEGYLNMGAGIEGILYEYRISDSSAFVQLVISNKNVPWNKSVFDFMLENKAAIEEAYQSPLVWDRSNDKNGSYIRFYIIETGRQGVLKEKEKWPELQDKMIGAMICLDRAFNPFIRQIDELLPKPGRLIREK